MLFHYIRYSTPAPAWSCAWNEYDTNYIYCGLQNGTCLVFDIRNTNTYLKSIQNAAGGSCPVISVAHVSPDPHSVLRWGLMTTGLDIIVRFKVVINVTMCTMYGATKCPYSITPTPSSHITGREFFLSIPLPASPRNLLSFIISFNFFFLWNHHKSGFISGHGKPGKSWNFRISFSRPGKSWNLGVGHGKSRKMMFIKSSFHKLFFFFFCEENNKNVPKMKDVISKKMVKFRSWKTWRSHGKGHGKSWNFKSSKEYEPCKYILCTIIFVDLEEFLCVSWKELLSGRRHQEQITYRTT